MLFNKSQHTKLCLLIPAFCLAIIFKINARVIKTISDPSITITASSMDACRNASITFMATVSNAGSNDTLQWKKNNINAGSDSINYTDEFFPGDVVVCMLISGSIVISSNMITLGGNVNNTQPVVTISADETTACNNSPITFIAANVSGSKDVSFNWLIDGTDFGNNNDTFVVRGIYNNSVINCIMSAPACRGYWSSISNDIYITTYAALTPSVSIATRDTSLCAGSEAAFAAAAENAGSSPSYQWKINGVKAGSNSSQFITRTLKDGDTISCTLTADTSQQCYTSPVALSNLISIKVSPKFNGGYFHIIPTVNNICAGDEVSFTADFVLPQNGSFTWQVNEADVKTFAYYNVFTTHELKNGDRVRCIYKSDNACTPIWISDTANIVVKPIPVITVLPADTAIMFGSQVQLKASIQGIFSNYKWEPPDKLVSSQTLTPLTVPLTSAVTYTLVATGDNNCSATSSAKIKLIYVLRMPNSFTPNGDGFNDVFRIPPPASLTLYNFSIYDRWGRTVFTTKDPLKGWDGRLKGVPLQTGAYAYFIKAGNELGNISQKGTVLLIR